MADGSIVTAPEAGPVSVINPNSSASVTGLIRRTLEPFAQLRFDYHTLESSPSTIVTDADVAAAGSRLARYAAALPAPRAVIIACFSDPGLEETRARLACPVIGAQNAAVTLALSLAERFGIIALSPVPMARHRRMLEEMGVLHRLADEVPLGGVSAHDAGHREDLYPELLAAGQRIVSAGGGAVILGCAGFGPRRARLEADIGVPVIDPVLAAAALASSLVAG